MKKLSLWNRLLTHAFLILISLILIVPFVFMISISLASDSSVVLANYTLIPREFHFENYISIFSGTKVGLWLRNSVIITVLSTLATLASCSLAAYAFARLRARGKNFWFIVCLSTMMIPSQVKIIPTFIIFRNLNWLDTWYPLIVPNLFGSAYYIFMLRQFIARLPRDLDEAAKLDGLGYFGIYARICLPLIKPALAAVAVFAIIGNWNWFFEPLIYLNSEDLFPLALGVKILTATTSSGAPPMWNRVFTCSMILILPMILVYFVGQKYMYELDLSAGSAGVK